jgi:hypothetical protein
MKAARIIAASTLAAWLVLGCTRESSHGPVQWTASNPSSPVGQTAAQAWSRSTSSDAPTTRCESPPTPSVARVPAGTVEDTAQQRAGVTSEQAPASRWPYDGVTLQLEPTLSP